MIKKHACYLSLFLLAAPLVATAQNELADHDSPLKLALTQLPVDCPRLAAHLSASAQTLLQAFYQQQDYVLIWTANGRLSALQAQVQQLADDGLDPKRYSLPTSAAEVDAVCADIGISQRYLQALQDLRYGRLRQSRFEPLWHAQALPYDRPAEVLAIAGPGLQDMATAFQLARPSLEQYQSLRRVYARQRQRPLPHWQALASGPLLQPGAQDARVPELAKRLFNEGYLANVSAGVGTVYNKEIGRAHV